MIFDQTAFADTCHQLRRDLEVIDQAIAWLAPCAYEQRAGGGGSTGGTCTACNGAGTLANGQPCEECVVATIGDVGEIVVRRHHVTHHLAESARDMERVWDIVKGTKGRVAKLANLIDKGASRLPGMEPISEDPREVAAQIARKAGRVARGEEPGPDATIAKHSAEMVAQKVKTQERIDEHRARVDTEGVKVGNRWRR